MLPSTTAFSRKLPLAGVPLNLSAVHFGTIAHICTDKSLWGDGRESQTGENTGLKVAEKDGQKLKKRYYVSIYG